jgi:hypothetical protein
VDGLIVAALIDQGLALCGRTFLLRRVGGGERYRRDRAKERGGRSRRRQSWGTNHENLHPLGRICGEKPLTLQL